MLGGHKGLYWFRRNGPYVQLAATRVTDTWFVVGLQTGERGRVSQVSGGRSERVLRAHLPLCPVLVSCSCVQIPPLHGAPCFPFYRRKESTDYRGGKGEEREREEGFQGYRVRPLLHASPTDPIDVNRDGSMSWPYSSLAPCAGVICRSWHPTPSRRTSW